MQPREYGFNDRMVMSQGVSASANVEDILLRNLPGAGSVHVAHTINDRNGTDYWVETISGYHLSVDTKVREEDWSAKPKGEDDLALETWSVVENGTVGWTRDPKKRCDYVLWLWKDTGRWCLVPFPMLCRVFADNWQNWSAEYKTCQQCTLGFNGSDYHSECVFVPRKVVWAEIYKTFSGLTKRVRPAA